MGVVMGTGTPFSSQRETRAKAWQRKNGQPLSKHELRSVSRSWSDKEWESYLTSIETKQAHYLPKDFERVLSAHDNIDSMIHFNNAESQTQWNELVEKLTPRLKDSLAHLEIHERRVITALYFRKQTQKEIAREMGVSDHTIRRIRRRALARLKAALDSVSAAGISTCAEVEEKKEGAK